MEMVRDGLEKLYTEEEYFALEEQALDKHDFYNGKIIKRAETNSNHNIICANILAALVNAIALKHKEYFVLTSDTKTYIPDPTNFLYPDAVVICEQIEPYPGSSTVITNPLLIVAVISTSTEPQDRTSKFYDYKKISTFKEYFLVYQSIPSVTSFFKIGEHTWQDTDAAGMDNTIYLQSVDCTIDLKKIYRGIKF